MNTKPLSLFFIFSLFLITANSFADANYSIRDSAHQWFPLTRANWIMSRIQYPSGDKQITLKNGLPVKKVEVSIIRGIITFGLGCNGHGGKLKLLPGKNLESEPLVGTLKGCKKLLQNADKEVSKLLSTVTAFRSNASNSKPTLELISKNGTHLYFIGEPIPEVKYGKPVVRRVEVKQRRKGSCAKQGCEEWREVFTNSKGEIINKSQWRYSPPEIRNFKVTPNTWYSFIINEFKTPTDIVWYVKYHGSSSNLEYAEGKLK